MTAVRVSVQNGSTIPVVTPIEPQPIVVYPGDQGPKGGTGPAGDTGPAGTYWYVGNGPPPTTLTPTPRLNDLYTDLGTSQVYELHGVGWVLQGTQLAPVGTDVVVSVTEPLNPRLGTIWIQP